MRIVKLAAYSICVTLLLSCASAHKAAISQEDIPTDISKYKVLYTEINFENTVSNSVAEVHNNAAKKHIAKKTGDPYLFVAESEINKGKYADVNVYRYVLLNRITKQLTKTYYRENMSTGQRVNDGQSQSYITEFYFLDRKTGKEYPHMKGSTMPLYLLKAIVDKVTGG
jgi:hypothetical protein